MVSIKRDLFGYPILPDIKILRIPYMGSKNSIAIMLLKRMLDLKPQAKYFVDLFGGGGAMAFTAHQIGLQVIYNEKQTSLVNFIKYIFDRIKHNKKGKFGLFPDDFYKFITREEFEVLKNEDSIKGQFARICYSFGNNQRSYLFGKDIEKAKELGHNIVMYQCEDSLKEFNKITNYDFVLSDKTKWNSRRLDYIRQFSREARDKKEDLLERLQQLEQLQRLEQLERLERLERLNNIQLFNLDYKDLIIDTPIEETIVYLDPPYRGTEKYIEGLDHDELDEYFRSSPYTCFMSEYNAPFESVLEIEKRSLLDNSNNSKKYALEQLYINK
jgi:site-specific DNA-adenine methylase